MSNYRDLEVWKQGKSLAVKIYSHTNGSVWNRDRGLQDQLRRAIVSVPSNIAEGDARRSERDSVRFFLIAQGSLAEVHTQMEIAMEIGYLPQEVYETLSNDVENLQRSLGALVKARKANL